jgi:serine/threonine protein kinase/Tfp pilus assembly protein PilF
VADWNPRANDLFLRAAEIESPEERRAFLDRECGDAALRREVEALLAASAKAVGFLSEPAVGDPLRGYPANGTAAFEPMPEAPGTVVGPYKLLQQIGEGGFGVVYMAEQGRPVRRLVALKVIKPGMDTAAVLARFEAERQALALMDHPNIAKVLDAGATDSGRPYFVMELVKGVPVTEFCDRNHLPPEQRLKLFVDVCHAIQHAHHKGVIHRDVKPTNVLVTLHDGVPVVKVIDFGVAKATAQKLTEKTLFTAYGQMVGTPPYMSPEQAEMSGLDVDTRSDVYSLGVLLYELLTGTTPLEGKRLRQAGYAEMQRLIREEDPPRPSTRLSALGESATVLAGNRGTDPKHLARLLAGDLDWVVMKALEKDRTRRYDTPGTFADDVARYLRREAVLARPPSAAYRLRKFAQRNRAAVLTAAAVAAALLLGTAVATWQAVRATAAERDARAARDAAEAERDRAVDAERRAVGQQRRADDEAAAARAINDFLRTDLLGQADVRNQPGGAARNPNVTVRDLLDRAAQQLPGKFAGRAATEAAIRLTLGDAYLALGEYAAAQKHLEQSLALRKQTVGPDHPDTLVVMNDLAVAYLARGRFDEAEALHRQALEGYRARLGADDPATLKALNSLAALDQARGRFDEAEALHRQALEGYRARFGADHPATAEALNNLAWLNLARRRYDEAEALCRQAVAVQRAKLGADHPATLLSLDLLARLHHARGRYDEAQGLFEQVLAARRAALGADHPEVLQSMNGLARLFQDRGRDAEAESLYRQALAGSRARLGPDHPLTLDCLNNLAALHQARGRYAEAEPLLREVVAAARTKPEPPDSPAALALGLLALNLLRQNKYAEAEPVARECLAVRAGVEPDAWTTFNARSLLGGALLGQKKYAEAEPLLRAGYEGMRQRQAAVPAAGKVRLAEAAARLVRLYDAWGRPDEAARWVPVLDQSVRPAPDPRAAPVALDARLRHFAGAKDIAGCRQTAEMWEALSRSDADGLYTAARMRAVTAAMLKATPGAAAARLSAEEADRAMAWLTKAVAAGYKDVEYMKADKDLDILRDRKGFQMLLADRAAGPPLAK